MFRALDAAIGFLKQYKFPSPPTAAEIKHCPAADQQYLGIAYEAESTCDLSQRTNARHPSYAVHNVSWSQFMDTSSCRENEISVKVVEDGKDVMVFGNVLSAEECESLIHLSERHGYVMLKSAENGGKGRTNTRVLTHDESLANLLYLRMKRFLPPFYRLTDGRMWNEEYDLCGLNERFRWCKYVEGQSFKSIHCDKRVSLPEQERYSFFTVNIYLNGFGTNYNGGRTIFYDQKGLKNGKNAQYEESSSFGAQTGDVMIFNHYPHKYPHCGEMLSSGTKYLLRSDVMYKKRRK